MSRVALKAPAPAARVAPAARPARGNRPSATAAPAAPIVTTDPATVVAWARLGPRAPLPRRADAEAVIGAPLDGLEVLLGERAQRACALLGARAFAVGNVIGFAERTPTLSQIIHEAAHVVQQRRAGVLHAPPSAPGSFAIAAPGERAEREAAAIAGGGARPRLSAAPLRLYRDPVDVDTKEDKLDKVFQKRVLAFMRSAKWHLKAEELTGTDEALGDRRAVVGRRDGDSFKLWWKESSPDVFKASDYRTALAVLGTTIDERVAKSDLAAARDDKTITQTGYVVDSKPTRLAVVGELDETGQPDTRAYYHALIGKSSSGGLDYFDRVQAVAAKGAAKSNPLTILDDLADMITTLRAAASGSTPKKQALPTAPFDDILARAERAVRVVVQPDQDRDRRRLELVRHHRQRPHLGAEAGLRRARQVPRLPHRSGPDRGEAQRLRLPRDRSEGRRHLQDPLARRHLVQRRSARGLVRRQPWHRGRRAAEARAQAARRDPDQQPRRLLGRLIHTPSNSSRCSRWSQVGCS